MSAGETLPDWSSALVVVAHPDDESFGLGAVIASLTAAGTEVRVLCFTRGEASTLNENDSELRTQRAAELRRASAELGVGAVELLDYPDGRLGAAGPPAELAGHVTRQLAAGADGLLVFDEGGITGHPDHRAATAAAVTAAAAAGLPVLAWALPDQVAARLRAETGQPFAGRPASKIDLRVQVDRSRQRAAALAHESQISPGAVLWRRLELQGSTECLCWLIRPPTVSERAGGTSAQLTIGPMAGAPGRRYSKAMPMSRIRSGWRRSR